MTFKLGDMAYLVHPNWDVERHNEHEVLLGTMESDGDVPDSMYMPAFTVCQVMGPGPIRHVDNLNGETFAVLINMGIHWVFESEMQEIK